MNLFFEVWGLLKPLARDKRQAMLKIEKLKTSCLINNPTRNEEKRDWRRFARFISIN